MSSCQFQTENENPTEISIVAHAHVFVLGDGIEKKEYDTTVKGNVRMIDRIC